MTTLAHTPHAGPPADPAYLKRLTELAIIDMVTPDGLVDGERVLCTDCRGYLHTRWAALEQHFRGCAARRGQRLTTYLRWYMAGVHARHLAGHSLDATS